MILRSAFFFVFCLYLSEKAEGKPKNYFDGQPPLFVLGGDDAIPGEAMFMVQIRTDDDWHCGGNLIDSKTVLTAAHCVEGKEGELRIRYGTHSTDTPTFPDIMVEKFRIHPNYTDNNKYDIAIIKLKHPVHLDKLLVGFIELSQKKRYPVGVRAQAFGWGMLDEDGDYPEYLQKTDLTVISEAECEKNFPGARGEYICVRNPRTDVCNGDSGSGLVYDNQLIGVLSDGAGNDKNESCFKGEVNAYVSTSFFFEWVAANRH